MMSAFIPMLCQAFHFGGASFEFDDDGDEDFHPLDHIRSGKLAYTLPLLLPFLLLRLHILLLLLLFLSLYNIYIYIYIFS